MFRIFSIVFVLVASVMMLADAHAQSNGPAAVAAARSCTPAAVGDFQIRIHVRCSTAVDGIVYYAVATTDSNRAARVLAILSGAFLGGHQVEIYYDPADLSGSSIGCSNVDCRLLLNVEIF